MSGYQMRPRAPQPTVRIDFAAAIRIVGSGYLSGRGTLLGPGALGDRGVRVALRRPRASAADGRSHLMFAIHPNARTTPTVRAEIARSAEPTGELAKRYGVSTETVRKWRKRGAADCLDRSSRPRKLPWKASEEERAVVCALRRATGFPLDDLTFVVAHFLPHLNRDAVYRILKAEGLNRRPAPAKPEAPASKFKEYELGFVHGRVQREVLGITVASHRDLERLLAGFNQAYNVRRQRVLGGRSPDEVVKERLRQDRDLGNASYRPPFDPCALPRAVLVIERAKD